jgi:hypothetical protein
VEGMKKEGEVDRGKERKQRQRVKNEAMDL